MTPREFSFLADLVRRRAGLSLPLEKKSLIAVRLKPVATRFGFRDVAALLAELPHPSEELASAIVEAMMTNETSFFRDRAIFDFLQRSAIPALIAARSASRRLRIWCSAASTGQEAYSLAMVLDPLVGRDWRVELIATDISEGAIARARDGRYTQFEVERGLGADELAKYFVREEKHWRVADRLKRMITFRAFNLLDHFGWLGELDVILCRNMLFYVEPHERANIHAKLSNALAEDGHLVLGENENVAAPFVMSSAARGVFTKERVRGLKRLAG